MSRKYFGTDGIRGKVGDTPITPQFFLHLGWAIGKALTNDKTSAGLVLIGKDTRISGYMFESALEAGLISAGVNVGLLGPMPTPAIAYLTRTFQAQGGIVISASHNPYQDNGIKLFNSEGTKLDDATELRIESLLDESMSTSEQLGKAHRIVDAEGRYIEFCKGSLPWGFNLDGMNIVLDCANGATYNIAPKVFRELGAEVTVIGASPDGLNINLKCGSTQLNALKKEVLEKHADLGIAFDGDGDRVLFVDQTGETVDGDQLLYIIARSKHIHDGGCLGVVGTLMTNLGFELGLKELGIPFERAKVGDRYVIESMKRHSWRLGGESSGHIVCDDITTTGDGVISALQVLKSLKAEGKTLQEAKQSMQKLPQVMINVKAVKKIDLDGNDTIQEAIRNVIDQMNGEGRVLLRPSGTEPVVRVMVEGRQHDMVSKCAKDLALIVEKVLAG